MIFCFFAIFLCASESRQMYSKVIKINIKEVYKQTKSVKTSEIHLKKIVICYKFFGSGSER